jgi:hypothetical protein
MVVNQSNRRISYIGGIVWLMGFGLLAAASIIIAMSLPIPSADVSGVMAWAQQHQTLLQLADEMLACGASILLVIVVVLYGKLRKRHPVGVSVLLALGIVVAIGAFYAMMALGRLVYPVNGLPTQQQVYYPRVNCLLGCIGWRWHWLHVLLRWQSLRNLG